MRYHTAWSSFLFLLFCFEVATSAASAQKVRLYVDNSEGDDVSVIDLKTLNTLGDIHLADKVHGLAIEADRLKDELDRGYWEVPVIYPASLLYLVSGLFEDESGDTPLVGMQRFFCGTDPYATSDIKAVVSYLQGKCVWSISQGGPGLSTSATKHGAFHDDPDTCKSLEIFLS